VVSVIAYFLLIGFPEDSQFLSEDEKHYIIARLNYDIGKATSNNVTFKKIMKILIDWKVWVMYASNWLK
jgi:hypothetical protein